MVSSGVHVLKKKRAARIHAVDAIFGKISRGKKYNSTNPCPFSVILCVRGPL
jgi:hypothetical protein